MNKLTLLFAVVLALNACKQNQPDNSNLSKDLSSLFSSYWEKNSKFFPLDATSQGDNRYNDQLPNDGTQGFRDSLKSFYTDYLLRLEKFNREGLTDNDKISYDIFKYDLQIRLDGLKLNTWMIPFQQFWGLPLTMGQLGSGEGYQPFKTVKDYENWLGRIKGFSVWADTAISNFNKGMNAGLVLPKQLVEKMIPQMEAMADSNVTTNLFYGPLKKFPKDFPSKDKSRITGEYKKAILAEIVPTYKKLNDFLKNEYLPKSRSTSGISSVPGGNDIYKFYVRYWTTTNKTPEDIYQIGLSEVKRIRTEMDSVINRVEFKGDLDAFFTYMKTDAKFMPYSSPKQIINTFNGIHKKMEPNLKKLYGRVPKTPFEVRQTEAFRAASASAEYTPGSPDGSRPGIFYIPILDAKTFNITSGMESLFLHEAIPGHHYQISLQQENKGLPKFRRFAWYGAMGEGYALYSESLGTELGLYSDPYQYMGALGDEMHRAVRLVVDVAIHTKNMSREEAIKYMMANEAISEEGATAEIERYMAIPGQALSYKIGALKIRELRSRYEMQMGDGFKISDFHDELLKDGVMPLDVLERKMDAWSANFYKK